MTQIAISLVLTSPHKTPRGTKSRGLEVRLQVTPRGRPAAASMAARSADRGHGSERPSCEAIATVKASHSLARREYLLLHRSKLVAVGRLRKGQLNQQVSFEFKTSLKRIPHGKMKSTPRQSPRHRVAFLEDATAAPAIEENPGGCAS